MSILADHQILALCKPPLTKLDVEEYERRISQGFVVPDPNILPQDYLEYLKTKCQMCTTVEEQAAYRGMIYPFHYTSIREIEESIKVQPNFVEGEQLGNVWNRRNIKIISKGVSSYGYDVTLAEEFKIFTNINSTFIDPKELDQNCLVDGIVHVDAKGGRFVWLPPNSYLLGRTVEYFRIPRDVMVLAVGKSTYARAGAIVNVTPIEAGFEGHVVIEISNSTPLPMKIYANEGVSQFVFFQGSEPCTVSYGDRSGKYQGQTGITLPTV